MRRCLADSCRLPWAALDLRRENCLDEDRLADFSAFFNFLSAMPLARAAFSRRIPSSCSSRCLRASEIALTFFSACAAPGASEF